MSASTPILFGVDPDEIWRYIPKAVKEAGAKLPAFLLKAPRLSLVLKYEALMAEVRATAYEAAPGVVEVVLAYSDDKGQALPDLTEDQRKERTAASIAWKRAFDNADAKHADKLAEIQEEMLASCITGWDGLTSASGKAMEYDRLKDRICEVLRGEIRGELVGAIMQGATVSDEDALGLPSSPA